MYGQKKGDAAKGKEVFDQCAVCHNSDSTDVKMGPGLKGFSKNPNLIERQAGNDATVMAKINEGGNGMPAYKDILSDDREGES